MAGTVISKPSASQFVWRGWASKRAASVASSKRLAARPVGAEMVKEQPGMTCNCIKPRRRFHAIQARSLQQPDDGSDPCGKQDELIVSGDFSILPQSDEVNTHTSCTADGAATESLQRCTEADPDSTPAPQEPVRTAVEFSGTGMVASQSSSTGVDELTENLLRGPFGPFVRIFMKWMPPKWMLRTASALILSGQVISRIARGKIHWKNTLQQLRIVGPSSLGVCLLTASFVGMVFTIQFAREFTKLGLTRSIGGVLALALARELIPVITSIILAGRVGSAFAAELGTMQVSQQTDTLWVLQTDPVDYLVTPRVLACLVALPMLVLLCFTTGMAASVLLADGVYNISANIMLDSAQRALTAWDITSSSIKSVVFGFIISAVSCSWGYTTTGGAKGVGESTTSAVVISLVSIFIADFVLSYLFFQGQGDAIKNIM